MLRKEQVFIVLTSLLLLVLIGSGVQAGTPQQEAKFTVRMDMPGMLLLELDPEELVFSGEEILSGDHPEDDPTVLVASKLSSDTDKVLSIRTIGNMPYVLMIGAESEYLTSAGGGIPFFRLEWRHSPDLNEDYEGSRDWTPIDWQDDVEVLRGAAGQEIEAFLDFRVVIHVTDPIGDYSGDLVFTLSARSE